MIANWLKQRVRTVAALMNVTDLLVQALGLCALTAGVLAIVLMLVMS